MRDESAPHPTFVELPAQGRFAPGWLGRALERVLTVAAAAGLFYFLYTQTTPRKRPPVPAAASAAAAQPAANSGARGSLAVVVPPGAVEEALRVSVLQGDTYAAPEKDLLMRLLSPSELAQAALPPGEYMVVISYREQVLPGIPTSVTAGKAITLPVPRDELARIEYETALARQNEGQNADIEHLEHVAALDPEHVDARLQLAAHALATGATRTAREHLDVVLRRDPGNPHAARIRRVLSRFVRR